MGINIREEFDHKLLHSSMQALAYWLGYEHERYRYYKLREIAIVSELVCLLDWALSKMGCSMSPTGIS